MSEEERTQSFEDETEDEEGLLLDEKVDKQIFNVLNALQKNDPSIYNRTRNFFDDEELRKLEKTDKSTLIHQYFTNKVNESELLQMRKKALEEFHNAVHEAIDNDDEENENDEILHRKVKTREDMEREEKEFQQFLKEQERKDKDSMLKQSASLQRYENDLNLTKEDEFLRDYLLNNKWVMKDDKKKKSKESGSFEELANELRSRNDSDYDSDGTQKDREFEELERKGQEEHLKASKLPTLAEHRFEEKGADKIINYTYKSTEREKKITAKIRKDLNRKVNKEKAKEAAREKSEKVTRELQIKVLTLLIELKKLIKGDGSVVDKLELEPDYLEDTEKIEMVWDQVEHHTVVEELLYGAEEDDYEESEDDAPVETDPNKRIPQLRGQIQKALSDYYDSFFTDADQEQSFRFKYKRVEKDDYGLTAEEILALDDDVLEEILPINHIKRYDAEKSTEEFKKHVREKVKQKLTRTEPAKKPSRKRKRRTKKNIEADESKPSTVDSNEEDGQNNEEVNETETNPMETLFQNESDDNRMQEGTAFNDDDFFQKKKRKIEKEDDSIQNNDVNVDVKKKHRRGKRGKKKTTKEATNK